MKKIMLFCAFLLPLFPTFSQNNDEEAIKEAIRKETHGAYYCDYDSWSSAVLRVDYLSIAATNFGNPGSLWYVNGLNFYDRMAKRLPSSNCQPNEIKVAYSDWNIQIRGDVAWANYKEVSTMPDGTDIEARNLKILEKHQGQWKIVAISSVWDFNHASKPWNPKGNKD